VRKECSEMRRAEQNWTWVIPERRKSARIADQ
jgi:hypothetical protein